MSLWVVLLSVVALAIPAMIVFFAGMTATRRLWAGAPVLAPLYSTLVLALASWVAFLATWASPALGVVVSSVLLAAATLAFAWGGLWRQWRMAIPLVAVGAGVIALSLGFAYLWGVGNSPYDVVAERFFAFRMPADNLIPSLFAQKIADGQSTTGMLGDWNGGDRPPLQSGFALLFRPLSFLAEIVSGRPASAAMPLDLSFALDYLAQLLWIPAAFALLRVLSFPRWVAVAGICFAALVPAILVNTLFTWPKVLSAALVLCSLAFLLAAKQHPHRFRILFCSAVLAAVLAVLAHGAAAFTIPTLVATGLYALHGQRLRSAVATIAIAAGVGLVVYAPWVLYQRLVDPPGDRLLKWHLAGVTQVDPRPFAEAFTDQYSQLTFSEFVANRLENLSTVFGSDQFERLADGRFSLLTFLRVEDYTSTMVAVGLIGLVLLVAMILNLAGRFRSLAPAEQQRLLIVVGMIVSVLVWSLVLFAPFSAIVPHGSHAWLFVLTLVPFCWLIERRPRTGLVLLGIQAALLVIVYFADIFHPDPHFSPTAAVVALAGLVVLLVVPAMLMRYRARAIGAAGD
ncbi:hypothetical protein ACEXQE_15960 [Herbiconiux sp. P17]|uniref:hypothetical protein n=1 Tax=Herbiconiux wuyangfengii TaxID=3342794 RepID=UPI0035B79757